MKQTKLFCHKVNDEYMHFYPSVIQVKMCGVKQEDIIEVIVREVQESEIPTYWGWWSNEEQRFSMIYSHLLGVKLCSPSGFKVEIERGKGNIYGLVVEEVI